eukprot:UN33280
MLKTTADKMGIEVHSKELVRDHFTRTVYHNDYKNDTTFTTTAAFGYPVNRELEYPILYQGIGMSLKSKTQFGIHLLTGEDTAYSKKGSGKQLGLVSSLQMRNNARLTLVGSIDMLSNEFAAAGLDVEINEGEDITQTSNAVFNRDIIGWTFQERGRLRMRESRHYLLKEGENATPNPIIYTIKEEIRFEFILEEYIYDCQCWKPYLADDVQLQLVRLDPFIRTFMKHDDTGLYFLEFILPDHFGVFKLLVDYKRKGYSYVYEEIE